MVAAVKNRNAVAPVAPAAPPAQLKKNVPAYLQKYDEDKGKGYSKAAEDSVVPFIDVCSSTQNPQLNPRHEKYIKGVMLGDILVKGGMPPFVGGQVGIEVQPCAFDKCWVEWVPRTKGGGFVTRHKDRPADTVERPSPEDPTKTRFYRANGNEVIETRYHYVLFNKAPYVMAFKSTGHTVSREWTNMMKLVGEGGESSFSHKYKLTTKLKTKGQQEWYIFSITPVLDEDGMAAYVPEAEYLAGQAFEKAVSSGMKVAADEEEPGAGAESEI
jgi:hypothetical protein